MSAVSQHVTQPQPQIVPPSAPPAPAHRPPTRSNKRWWIAGLLVALIAAVAIYRTQVSQASKPVAVAVKTATVELGNLDSAIRVAGQTAAIDFSNVTAPTLKGPEARDMVILKVAAAGSWVKKGEQIASLDGQVMADHIEDLGDTIEAATADVSKRGAEQGIELENLQQTIRVSKAAWDKAKLEYGAAEVKTDVERQLLKLTLDETEAKHNQQISDISHKKLAHAAELKILALTRERHTRHRDRHKNDLKAFTIFAAMDGLVVMQPIFRGSEMGQFQQGDRLSPGQPFMKVVNTKKMQVEATINQTEVSKFRVGQDARIRLDAFKGLEFDGKVHSLGALAVGGYRQGNYIRTVPVRIRIEGSDAKLIPDLSASADVKMGSASGQAIVPLNALTDENGKMVAYVKNGEGFEAHAVELGLQNDTHAVVTAGLKTGDVVRLN